MIVVQQNYLIDARQQLTLVEKRLILMMLARMGSELERSKKMPDHIREEGGKSFPQYTITVEDYMNEFGIKNKTNLYRDMRLAAEKLIGRHIFFKDGGIKGFVNWFEYIIFVKREIVFKCTDLVWTAVTKNFGGWTQYDIKEIADLNSIYSVRLFEYLYKFFHDGNTKNIITVDVMELKRILACSEKYTMYSNFRIKILEPAIIEINQKTRLKFNHRQIKSGRNIDKIEFTKQPKVLKNE